MIPTDETERGRWMTERTGRWGTVGGVAATGFEAYARILHPASVSAMAGVERWTWRQVADRTGRVVHPLAQWERIGALEQLELGHDEVTGVPVQVCPPSTGGLEPDLLAALVPALAAATASAELITVGVWSGWGDDIRRGASFERPGRDFELRAGTLAELADPEWPRGADLGWGAVPGAVPQLVWPADQAWLIASDVDWDSTIVAGSTELIEAVLATEAVEALPIGEHDSLMIDSDRVNARVVPR